MDVLKFLDEIKKVIALIENKTIEAMQWQNVAEGTSGSGEGERVRSSNVGKMVETGVVNKVAILEEVENLKIRLAGMLKLIEQLPADEYDLIHKVYVQDYTLKQFARSRKRGDTWASEKHKSAKLHLQEVLKLEKINKHIRTCKKCGSEMYSINDTFKCTKCGCVNKESEADG